MERTGAVPARRLYIKAAGSKADEEVGSSVMYPHPIGGGRDVRSGSCCAGCQEHCC